MNCESGVKWELAIYLKKLYLNKETLFSTILQFKYKHFVTVYMQQKNHIIPLFTHVLQMQKGMLKIGVANIK